MVIHMRHASRLLSPSVLGLLPRRNFLVRPLEDHTEREDTKNRDSKVGQYDAVALAESVVREVPDVTARYIAQLTEGVQQGDRDGPLCRWPGEGGRDPRVEDDEAAFMVSLK